MRLSVNFLHFYLSAWVGFHQAGDNYAVAGFQAVGNQPFVTNRLVRFQRAHFDFIVSAHHHRGSFATRVTRYTLLWHQQCIAAHAFVQTGANEHTWQQRIVRVREQGANGD
ncbi:hypothetical protein D3C80_1615140 [compost metagenome]